MIQNLLYQFMLFVGLIGLAYEFAGAMAAFGVTAALGAAFLALWAMD